MGQSQDHLVNQAPAVPLDSADYLTDRKTIREYETIQYEHLNRPSWLGRFAARPGTRRVAREILRFIMFLVALCVAAALIYYLEHDASRALGD